MTEHAFSLTRGGPFYRLLLRAHLTDAAGKVRPLALAAIAWIPLAAVALAEIAVTGDVDPMFTDASIHVRLLVMLPLLVAAENLLEVRCATAVHHAYVEKLAPRGALDAIVGRAGHVRDAWQAEAVILALVVIVGQLWLRSSWSGVHHGSETFTRVWCFVFALPLAQFVLVRWLWRWALWTYVLADLARLPLALDALHPDRAAGLRILSGPVEAFAVYVAAIMSMFSASWWERIHAHEATVKSLTPQFFTYLVVAVVVACGPLVLFSRQIYRARHRDATAYHALAREYADAFRAKWLETRNGEQILGTSDIQSLSDLANSYHAAEDTRLYPFGARVLIALGAGAFIPLVPTLLATAPMTQLATHLGRLLFGIAG